jgi:hypothetical protein
MSEIITLDSVTAVDDRVDVVAVVDDAVVAWPQTFFEPEEYGPALCRGSFDLDTDDVMPEDYEQLREFIQQRVHQWEPIDTSES